MCDNDILYGNATDNRRHNEDRNADSDAERLAEELESVMTELGYTPEHVGGVHDVYQKKPFFNFEMHRKLVPEDSTFAKYYENPWDRAHLGNGKMYEYHFSDEDEYIYMLVHAYKHYDVSGCGIRTLVDEYVWRMKPEYFETDEKHELLKIITQEVAIAGRKEVLDNAIKIYVKSVFDVLENANDTTIRFYEK